MGANQSSDNEGKITEVANFDFRDEHESENSWMQKSDERKQEMEYRMNQDDLKMSWRKEEV